MKQKLDKFGIKWTCLSCNLAHPIRNVCSNQSFTGVVDNIDTVIAEILDDDDDDD